MHLKRLVDEVANDADSFLIEVEGRKETREAIAEYVREQYPDLSRKEQTAVIHGVLDVLEGEDYFGDGSELSSRRGGHGNIDDEG